MVGIVEITASIVNLVDRQYQGNPIAYDPVVISLSSGSASVLYYFSLHAVDKTLVR